MTLQPDDGARPHERPPRVPDLAFPLRAPTPGPGRLATAAAGCGGVMLAFFVAILFALGVRNAMISLPFAALALFGISVARVRGAEGRVLAVRVAIGVGLGALIFGGCIALLASGRWRIAG